jgi:hypothetical protein
MPGLSLYSTEECGMRRKDPHAIHLDDADRHTKQRRIPIVVAVVVAAAIIALLEWLHRAGISF